MSAHDPFRTWVPGFALILLKRPNIDAKVSGYRLNEDDFMAAV